MRLENALDQVEDLSDEYVIFARRPWNLNSDAKIGQLDNDFRVPKSLADQGFEYFIDAPVAKEVLSVFGTRKATVDQRRMLLLYYAENDAYPDWVYES